MQNAPELKFTEVTGLIKIVSIKSYKDATLLIQSIGDQVFQYVIYWRGSFFTDFTVMELEEGKKLDEAQIQESFHLIMAMAETTVDVLRGEEVTGEEAEKAQAFIDTVAQKRDKVIN